MHERIGIAQVTSCQEVPGAQAREVCRCDRSAARGDRMTTRQQIYPCITPALRRRMSLYASKKGTSYSSSSRPRSRSTAHTPPIDEGTLGPIRSGKRAELRKIGPTL